MSLEKNIKIICEDLAEDLASEFDKDKAMILNNLCEYVLPKKQRIGHDIGVSEKRDFVINYYYGDQANGSTEDSNGETPEKV